MYLTMVRYMRDRIDSIREFNRALTRRIGALDSSFMGCGVSLGIARLLFEIAHGKSEVQRLREDLDLDSGQMSRMLRSIEKQGLIETTVHPEDGRARVLKLTRSGRAKLATLERKADEGARSWLAPLSERRQGELRAAMDTVARLLGASEITIEEADPESEAARWCLEQFRRELDSRFESGFDFDRAASAKPDEVSPPAGWFLVARSPGGPVGCGALKVHRKDRFGEIKRMWISPAMRGLGAGRRVLEALESRAKRAALPRVRLSTHRVLTEAHALYRASGYREIPLFDDEPYAHLAFEKRLR